MYTNKWNNMNDSTLENVGTNISAAIETDVRSLATTYLMYKMGNWLSLMTTHLHTLPSKLHKNLLLTEI